MVYEGDKAPDFSLENEQGEIISLSAFKGKKVVLYFYPRDNTPGCTVEACSFRDVYDDIGKKGAVIIGISADSKGSHRNFKNKYSLPFHLLSDPEKKAISSYGTWGEKSMMGKIFNGILRMTFIIDEKGIIKKIFPKVTPKEHAKEVLANL
jgi:peroxiredoxin Q/BCP